MSDVTMLTSLKALLFSSAATRAPADGAGALAVPGEGGADFAQLLSGTIDASSDAPPMADPTEVEMPAIDASAGALPFGLATALNAVQGDRDASLPLPPGLAQRVEEVRQADDADAEDAEEAPLASPSGDMGLVVPVAREAVDLPEPPPVELADGGPAIVDQPVVMPEQGMPPAKPAVPAQKAEIALAGPLADESTVAQAPEEKAVDREQVEVEGEAAQILIDAPPQPLLVAVPVVLEPLPQPMPIVEEAQSGPQAPPASNSDLLGKATPQVRADQPGERGGDAGQADPAVHTAVRPDDRAGPVRAAWEKASAAMPTAIAQTTPGTREPSRPSSPDTPSKIISAEAFGEQSATVEPPLAAIQEVVAQPVKSEALALLQMVNDQVAARQSGAPIRGGEQLSAVARTKPELSTVPKEAAIPGPIHPLSTDAVPQASPSQPSALAAPSTIAAAPVVDLSASLGAQVVDMGVSGQWIDGLARDIAGLSANGAQGRFQVNTDQLGPVQVDIRQGQDGAAVSLTVASEAAELALRQDSDRLRLDAGLAAVRITDVKIERAPHVAEAARTDNQQGSQQQPQQQSSQQQSAQNAWTNSQNMGQSQGQGRWRAQENSGFTPKNSGDPAVLNHDDMRRAGNDTVRARYA